MNEIIRSTLEWCAAVGTLIAFWRMGKHVRDGFLWMATATTIWTIWGILLGSAPVIGINLVGTLLNIRSWLRWHISRPEV